MSPASPEQPDRAGNGPTASPSLSLAPGAFVPFLPRPGFPSQLQLGLQAPGLGRGSHGIWFSCKREADLVI